VSMVWSCFAVCMEERYGRFGPAQAMKIPAGQECHA
jgi:hypothetical protein